MQKYDDPWLSDVFGIPVFRIDVAGESGSLDFPDNCFAYAKVDVRDIKTAKILTDMGFFLVDTNMTYIGEGRHSPSFESNGIVVRNAIPADEATVRDIAATSFTFTRFHADPFVDNQVANQIKADWAGNFFAGKRGDKMLLAEKNGEVIGFNQILVKGGVAIVDLIAVVSHAQGCGAGKAMIGYMQQSYDRCRVGTQLVNMGAIALYEKMGFCFEHAHYVFHYHGVGKSQR